MIRRRAWCERGEQTDFDALVQHVFGHGAIGCPFPARDGNQPAWADQHSVFAADFFRVFALFVVGWPHQWPQPDPDTADIVPGWPAPSVIACFAQDEFDLLSTRVRLARQNVNIGSESLRGRVYQKVEN